MGWGCYVHEWDAGSENWLEYANNLCNERLLAHDDWGRDGQICPKCYVEMAEELQYLRNQVRSLLDRIGEYPDQCVCLRGKSTYALELNNGSLAWVCVQCASFYINKGRVKTIKYIDN